LNFFKYEKLRQAKNISKVGGLTVFQREEVKNPKQNDSFEEKSQRRKDER
jgi:hypothetical protein